MVEDSKSLADLLAEGLTDQGIAAASPTTVRSAFDKLVINAYDVVVLDRTLPGIPGDALCEMIRRRNTHYGAGIFLSSACCRIATARLPGPSGRRHSVRTTRRFRRSRTDLCHAAARFPAIDRVYLRCSGAVVTTKASPMSCC